ncbi:MAG TPA: beta-galactosidase [Terriglobales bacterium]|nr:beta-galactosidase [Terriglobales bacterium]
MLSLLKNKILIGKEEYYLNSAEIHYFRVSKKYWSVCFERIKKAGFKIISTPVPWNLHEVSIGVFDFNGETDSRTDLVVFLELAREFGFKVILKIGPYIGSEWKNGGYPDFVLENQDLLARDPQGNTVAVSEQKEFPEIALPSFGHPSFKNHYKRYLNALNEVLKHYIYPKGPVVVIQLGRKTGLNYFSCPFKLDYNSFVIQSSYPGFLKDRYKEIKNLKSAYKIKAKRFEEFQPPKGAEIKKPAELLRFLDWIDFKSGLVSNYILNLKELISSAQVSPLFFTDIFWEDNLFTTTWFSLQKEEISEGMEVDWFRDYTEFSWNLRSFVGSASFPWSSEFRNGAPALVPQGKKTYFPLSSQELKFLLISSLAFGIKGFNHTMFVERSNWYGSPLAEDGTIQEGYELIKNFNLLQDRIGTKSLENLSQINLLNYDPYLHLSRLKNQTLFPYLNSLLRMTHSGLSQSLRNLKFGYLISNLGQGKKLEKSKVLLVPVAEFMDAKAQTFLLDEARNGKSLVLYGLLPRLDRDLRKCEILSRGLKIKTTQFSAVDKIQTPKEEFSSQVYGFVKSHSRNYQVIARAGRKIVGVRGKLGKGKISLFTFDISSSVCSERLSFLDSVLRESGVTRFLNSSDPDLEMVIQKNEKVTLLYLISPGVPFSPEKEGLKKNIILEIDCSKIGIKGKKITLTELLDGQIIKTTSEELKKGISMEFGKLESKIYLVEGIKGK